MKTLTLILWVLCLGQIYRAEDLQEFIESRPESLVLFYNDPNPNFLRISQHFTSNGFPIKIHEVNASNYEEMYNKYKIDYYPVLRFYLKNINLYVDYLGDLTESEEDIEEADDEPDSLLLENLSDFLDSRITNSYKHFDMDGQEKFKDAMMNDRFSVIYIGEEAEGCFKLFEALSKINERDAFFRISSASELNVAYPDIGKMIRDQKVKGEIFMKDFSKFESEGLYLVSNFEDKLHIAQLCNPSQAIAHTGNHVIEANKLVKEYRFPQLKPWALTNEEELVNLKHKFILVFYEPFFDHSVVSESNKQYIMNLYDDVKEKIRKFNYYDGVVPVLHLNSSCKECADYFKEIVGQSHLDSFLYFFEIRTRGQGLKEIIKYRFVIENMYKVKFNIRSFLAAIRDEKIKEFYRSEALTKVNSNENPIVEQANTNMLIERYKKKNKRTEIYLCYKDQKRVKEFERAFRELKVRGVKLYILNLNNNEIPPFIIKKQEGSDFILLKKKNKKIFKIMKLEDKSLQNIKVDIFGKAVEEAFDDDL